MHSKCSTWWRFPYVRGAGRPADMPEAQSTAASMSSSFAEDPRGSITMSRTRRKALSFGVCERPDSSLMQTRRTLRNGSSSQPILSTERPSTSFLALPAFVWVEPEPSAVEEDCCLEVLAVAEAACRVLDPLDLRVHTRPALQEFPKTSTASTRPRHPARPAPAWRSSSPSAGLVNGYERTTSKARWRFRSCSRHRFRLCPHLHSRSRSRLCLRPCPYPRPRLCPSPRPRPRPGP